jgi:hypothetical protein
MCTKTTKKIFINNRKNRHTKKRVLNLQEEIHKTIILESFFFQSNHEHTHPKTFEI